MRIFWYVIAALWVVLMLCDIAMGKPSDWHYTEALLSFIVANTWPRGDGPRN